MWLIKKVTFIFQQLKSMTGSRILIKVSLIAFDGHLTVLTKPKKKEKLIETTFTNFRFS